MSKTMRFSALAVFTLVALTTVSAAGGVSVDGAYNELGDMHLLGKPKVPNPPRVDNEQSMQDFPVAEEEGLLADEADDEGGMLEFEATFPKPPKGESVDKLEPSVEDEVVDEESMPSAEDMDEIDKFNAMTDEDGELFTKMLQTYSNSTELDSGMTALSNLHGEGVCVKGTCCAKRRVNRCYGQTWLPILWKRFKFEAYVVGQYLPYYHHHHYLRTWVYFNSRRVYYGYLSARHSYNICRKVTVRGLPHVFSACLRIYNVRNYSNYKHYYSCMRATLRASRRNVVTINLGCSYLY